MSLKRHLGRYALSGLLQWALEYAVVLALSQWVLPIASANVIGRVCGALFGFWLNGRWTFAGQSHGLSRRAGLRFVLVWTTMTALNTAWVGLIAYHTDLRTAQLLKPAGDIITAGLGFLLSRHWIYRR